MKDDDLYTVELKESFLFWAPFEEPNDIFEQVLLQLDQLKATVNKKKSETTCERAYYLFMITPDCDVSGKSS